MVWMVDHLYYELSGCFLLSCAAVFCIVSPLQALGAG
jgi:hypothetical protein